MVMVNDHGHGHGEDWTKVSSSSLDSIWQKEADKDWFENAPEEPCFASFPNIQQISTKFQQMFNKYLTII